jgi:glutamine amidotransferase
MKLLIVNYGMGNLGSVCRSFEELGVDVMISSQPEHIEVADAIVLPGVGAFSEGMANLQERGWVRPLTDAVNLQHKPLLGICLGMQMLGDLGTEGGNVKGLGLIPGSVQKLDALGCLMRIPHVGWNEVKQCSDDPLFEGIRDASDFYFVHSYAFVPKDKKHLIASVPYGIDVTAVVKNKSVYGCQFHPEKSSRVGRRLLQNFLKTASC